MSGRHGSIGFDGPPRPASLGRSEDAVPSVTTRRLMIRAAHPDDYAFLYSLEAHPTLRYRWSTDREMPTFELFVQRMSQDPARQFVVLNHERERLGWLQAYNENLVSGHAWIGVFMRDEVIGTGLGIESIAVFLHYLFTTRPYRKLYAAVTEGALPQFGRGEGRYFHVEGCLRENDYYNGSLHDRTILAFYATQWLEIMNRWGPRYGCDLKVN